MFQRNLTPKVECILMKGKIVPRNNINDNRFCQFYEMALIGCSFVQFWNNKTKKNQFNTFYAFFLYLQFM